MIVIGAGMAGLLAASIMRHNCDSVLEAQPQLPDNHSAVLRFKSSIVGDTCNIPFKEVKAIKSFIPWKNTVADVMAYSNKTNGDYRLRSIVTADGTLVQRYVAPPDFTNQLAKSLNAEIKFNTKISNLQDIKALGTDIVSTLPMPLMMKVLEYPDKPDFKWISGYNILCKLKKCNMYCSVYVPDPEIGTYRISINGDNMIAEVASIGKQDFHPDHPDLADKIALWRKQALEILNIGLDRAYDFSYRKQPYMKILPIEDSVRERFIIWATDTHRVYSLGRFATWRPNVLLDDVVKDVRIIQNIIRRSPYAFRKTI